MKSNTGDFSFNFSQRFDFFFHLKLKSAIKTLTRISHIFKCKIHFSRQSRDTVKYLFLLSVRAWVLTAGGEWINNVIKTHSPHALSPSLSSGEWPRSVCPNRPAWARLRVRAFSLLLPRPGVLLSPRDSPCCWGGRGGMTSRTAIILLGCPWGPPLGLAPGTLPE